MVERLDMTLDDIIKKKKHSEGRYGDLGRRGRGGGGRGLPYGSGPAPTHQFLARDRYGLTTCSVPPWVQRRETWNVGGRPRINEVVGTKLFVSNLPYDVTDEALKGLFSKFGVLKRCGVHYYKDGRSRGTADIEYVARADALAAFRGYNNQLLGGRLLTIEYVGVNAVTPVPPARDRIVGNQRGAYRRWDGSTARGGGRAKKRGRNEKVTAEALDADLEKYHRKYRRIG